MKWSWTQPCCEGCWYQLHDHDPHRMREEFCEEETCVYCGVVNRDGIYVRVDPALAKYPTLDD